PRRSAGPSSWRSSSKRRDSGSPGRRRPSAVPNLRPSQSRTEHAKATGHQAPRAAQPAGLSLSCGALAADQLAVPLFGKLAPVVHKEATRASELVRLPGDHPERELLVRQISPRKLKRLSHVVRIKVDGARRLVH